MILSRLHAILAVAMALLLDACASGELNATPAQAGIASACCTDAASIVVAGSILREQTVILSRTSLHFNFGGGLAPVTAFKLPADAGGRELELRARSPYTLQLAAQTSYYSASTAVFLDERGSVLASTVTGPSIRR